MAILTRRDFVKAAGAAATLPMLGSRAFAQDKLKVGFIFLGPIGDYGWTWAHNKGRLALEVIELADVERPPMVRIPEYVERRGRLEPVEAALE